MMRTIVLAVICVLIGSSLTDARRLRRSADLALTVDPSTVFQNETAEVTISCQPPELDDVFQVMLIFLNYRGADDLSSSPFVQQNSKGSRILASGNITDRLTAEGNVQGVDEEGPSFLTVTISEPEASDSGHFSCRFVYLDTSFDVKQLTAEKEFTVIPPNVTEVVEIVPEPETTTAFFVEEEEEVCNCSTIREEIDDLRNTLVVENAELKALLREKAAVVPAPVVVTGSGVDASCQASFSARLSVRGIPMVDGSTIPFNQAVSNKGGKFNPGSGVFTAPCDGQYFFSLTIRSYQWMDRGKVEGAIVANGVSQARTNVFLDHDSQHYESAGATAVVTLSAGQEVKVIVSTTSSGQILGGEYSVFSGFFLF